MKAGPPSGVLVGTIVPVRNELARVCGSLKNPFAGGPAMQPILAIDMGKNKSVFCDYTPGTDQKEFGTLPTSPKDFHDLLVARPGRLVVIEVGPLAGWVVDLCITLGVPFKVVNTGSEEWSWKRVKNKSDRDDALKCAKMEAMHLHRYVHVPKPQVRQWRELIHYREQYVGQVTAS